MFLGFSNWIHEHLAFPPPFLSDLCRGRKVIPLPHPTRVDALQPIDKDRVAREEHSKYVYQSLCDLVLEQTWLDCTGPGFHPQHQITRARETAPWAKCLPRKPDHLRTQRKAKGGDLRAQHSYLKMRKVDRDPLEAGEPKSRLGSACLCLPGTRIKGVRHRRQAMFLISEI